MEAAAAVPLDAVVLVDSTPSAASCPSHTLVLSATRRDAIVDRAMIYRAQLAERAAKNDSMWSNTVRHLHELHTLKLLYEKQRRLENYMFFLALFSVVAEATAIYIFWHFPWATLAIEGAKGLVTLATAAMLVLLFCRYDLAALIQVASYKLPPTSKFYHTTLIWDFCLECCLLLLHIPPGLGQYTLETLLYIYVDYFSTNSPALTPRCPKNPMYVTFNCYATTTYSVYQFGIVMVARVYLIGRYIRNVFGFNTNEVKLIGSLQNVDATSAWFVRKFLFRFYPAAFSALILVSLWTVTAWAVDQAEHTTVNGDLADYVDVLWLVIVTIVTVGYGDSTVVGFPGRLFVVLGGVVGGAAICSMCRVVVVGALAITPNEQSVMDTITERDQLHEMRALAVQLIQAEWRRYKLMAGATAGHTSHDIAKMMHTARVLKYRVMARARTMRRMHQQRHQGLDAILHRWKGKIEDGSGTSAVDSDRSGRLLGPDTAALATCDDAVIKLRAVLDKLTETPPH